MADKKRKVREESNTNRSRGKSGGNKKSFHLGHSQKKAKNKGRRTTGPRLPSALQKEFPFLKPTHANNDDEIDSDVEQVPLRDFYEYDETIPEEESKKNRRFDPVENLEYELPENFEDENLPSDDDDDDDNVAKRKKNKESSNLDQSGDEIEEDDARHARMLQGITGMPAEAFEGRPRKKNNLVVSEAYPESEYNPSRGALDGNGQISIQDLLDPLQEKPIYTEFRKKMHQLSRKSLTVQPPLPKVVWENLERKVAYEKSKKDITKWEPLVKRNREAPTIFFDEDTNLGFSTIGAMASEFEPRTNFEKKIASLVHDANIVEAHKEDGAKLLELNKISVEDVKDRQNRLAKMRSLLFRHEMKAKHIKKIKSKTFHRLLKKDKLKATSMDLQMDPEAAKKLAIKQEFKRAEERITLKHKNSSKWAKRILKRGLNAQDEGTRAAISEQLHRHTLLTRKINSMGDTSSDDESSDEDDIDDLDHGTERYMASKLLTKAKEKTVEVMEEEDEIPESGVLSLPFMVRGLKKKREEADAEAKLVLEEYESSLKQLEGGLDEENQKVGTSSGRRVFGAAIKQSEELNNAINNDGWDSDSEVDVETNKNANLGSAKIGYLQEAQIGTVKLAEESEHGQDSELKSVDSIIQGSCPKTTYESALLASESWNKNVQMKTQNITNNNIGKPPRVVLPASSHENLKEVDEDNDTESGEEMVDGILSSGPKQDYELPSQADLIHIAFAGDDVEQEFEQDKQEILNEENPEPEKPVLLPGWGQWTHVQQKKGLPSWILKEHENAKRKREESLKKRKDAHLNHVIISEKVNKKAEKLHTKTLPFPYTSKEVFEQSIRVPIGPEFNPATSIGALNRPEVVKTPGVIIKPIKFEDVDPHDKVDERKSKGHEQRAKKSKISTGKVKKR